jgi:hypothetical protein
MDCTTLRQTIGADPAIDDERAAAHERECSACAAYAQRLRSAEALISTALRVDVNELKRTAAVPARQRRRSRPWLAAAAAGFVAVAAWFGSSLLPSDDPAVLANDVMEHWQHEPEAWVRTTAPVAADVLNAVLAGHATVDQRGLNVVSYARSCLINGHWVPHLVVQGAAGPVMVLLLSREQLAAAMPLEMPAEGLRGFIVPLGEGSVAILAEEGEQLDAVREGVTEAVEWTI